MHSYFFKKYEKDHLEELGVDGEGVNLSQERERFRAVAKKATKTLGSIKGGKMFSLAGKILASERDLPSCH
jgi:hypothetical protein